MSPPIGTYLATYRQARGLSQRALAARARVSRPHLHALEAGTRQPSRKALEHLITALRLSDAQADGLRLLAGYAPSPAAIEKLAALLRAG